MKKLIHRADKRGFIDHGWLKTYHSFSFGEWYNPEQVRFGLLRVINDDSIEGGHGFGEHPHDNMEIVTIMLEGSLRHQDSMGNDYVISEGEVQRMSAGTGIRHSEFNASKTEPAKLLQIWVFPKEKDIKPSYEQKRFAPAQAKGGLQTIVSPDGQFGSLSINQDAYFHLSKLTAGEALNYEMKREKNGLYLFVISGSVMVDGEILNSRDGIGLSEAESAIIQAESEVNLLFMEIPMN